LGEPFSELRVSLESVLKIHGPVPMLVAEMDWRTNPVRVFHVMGDRVRARPKQARAYVGVDWITRHDYQILHQISGWISITGVLITGDYTPWLKLSDQPKTKQELSRKSSW
jgi:hypothetical protein